MPSPNDAGIRKHAAEILRENSKWAHQRGMSFTAREREKAAQRAESGGHIDEYLWRKARDRFNEEQASATLPLAGVAQRMCPPGTDHPEGHDHLSTSSLS